MNLTIVTNPEHAYLGWGTKTESVEYVAEALNNAGIDTTIVSISTEEDLEKETEALSRADLVWPNTYHYNKKGVTSSLPQDLESIGARLVGPTSQSLETVLLKDKCQSRLREFGVPTPGFISVNGETSEEISHLLTESNLTYPIIVKSAEGSISSGILPDSVKEFPCEVPSYVEKLRRIANPRRILLEEYIGGPEFTVAAIGNGEHQKIYAVNTRITDPVTASRKYSFLDGEMRPGCLKKGLVKLEPVTDENLLGSLKKIAQETCQALDIYDWTRFDGRLDSNGSPRVFDVNGMPGLSLEVSVTTHQFSALYPDTPKEEVFQGLVYSIVHSAATRHGITPTTQLTDNALYLK
jgi:D-alanine-D-alanine ligase-like ATP-grasp enzyme